MSRIRKVGSFINGGSDSNTFESILDMQTKITSLLGIDVGHIVNLYRFEGVPNYHRRVLATTNDGSGVAVRINTSVDKDTPAFKDVFANIVVGSTYYDTDTGATVMWNGTEAVLPSNTATKDEVFASCGFETLILEGDMTIHVGQVVNLTYIEDGEYTPAIFKTTSNLIAGIDGETVTGVSEGIATVSCGGASIKVTVIPNPNVIIEEV